MTEQNKKYDYIDGNTVRKLEPAYNVEVPLQEPEREVHRESEKKPLSQRALRNQERALRMSAPYMMMLVMATIALLAICVVYLNLQSSITTRIYNIEQYEAQLAEVQAGNKSLEAKINDHLDLEYIYQVATEELGMIHPAKDQVIRYERTESEYVRQYENIPE